MMQNHQTELGSKLAEMGYLLCTTCDQLAAVIERDLPAFLGRARAHLGGQYGAEMFAKQMRMLVAKETLPVKAMIILGSGGHTTELTTIIGDADLKSFLAPWCFGTTRNDQTT